MIIMQIEEFWRWNRHNTVATCPYSCMSYSPRFNHVHSSGPITTTTKTTTHITIQWWFFIALLKHKKKRSLISFSFPSSSSCRHRLFILLLVLVLIPAEPHQPATKHFISQSKSSNRALWDLPFSSFASNGHQANRISSPSLPPPAFALWYVNKVMRWESSAASDGQQKNYRYNCFILQFTATTPPWQCWPGLCCRGGLWPPLISAQKMRGRGN